MSECPICGYTKGMKEGTVKMMISFLLEDFTPNCITLLKNHFIYEFLEKVEHKWTMSKDYKSTANFGMLYEEVGMLYEELEGNQ